MTVAFNDVVLLRDLLLDVKNLADWSEISVALKRWYWARKPLASTINILSVALYDLFGAHGMHVSCTSILFCSQYAARQIPSLRFFGRDASSILNSVGTAFASP